MLNVDLNTLDLMYAGVGLQEGAWEANLMWPGPLLNHRRGCSGKRMQGQGIPQRRTQFPARSQGIYFFKIALLKHPESVESVVHTLFGAAKMYLRGVTVHIGLCQAYLTAASSYVHTWAAISKHSNFVSDSTESPWACMEVIQPSCHGSTGMIEAWQIATAATFSVIVA